MKGWTSTLCGETLFKNYGMYNKNDEFTGQNCIWIEEDTITFFSTIKEGPGSNCCQFHAKSMTLFLSNPAFFLLLCITTRKHTDKTPLSTNIKRTHSCQKKKKNTKGKTETQRKIETRNITQNQPSRPPISESISVLKFAICVDFTIMFWSFSHTANETMFYSISAETVSLISQESACLFLKTPKFSLFCT